MFLRLTLVRTGAGNLSLRLVLMRTGAGTSPYALSLSTRVENLSLPLLRRTGAGSPRYRPMLMRAEAEKMFLRPVVVRTGDGTQSPCLVLICTQVGSLSLFPLRLGLMCTGVRDQPLCPIPPCTRVGSMSLRHVLVRTRRGPSPSGLC